MLVGSALAILQGVSALNKDRVLVAGPSYVYSFNLTAWGWIHIVLGIIGVAISFGLAMGTDWARISTVVIASISIVAQFLWLPYYPLWAILIIAIDIVIIWAVVTWRTESE